ncbi:hypothetical protein JVX91_28015 [Pseudomonas sp. PDNC002]|uniref:hypothetical protein n=1 Tax=Pseudomonas sp. PDNC002 TaxID=2811422 RepID=UPI001963AF72|nr:hypothetical protein [Pseudomonas sp. PDNC002]QRY79365.1 hypothetical protein JVX91_28015 [Pseudomonas sp. PDNC002]
MDKAQLSQGGAMWIARSFFSGITLFLLSELVCASEPAKAPAPAFMVRFDEGFSVSNAHVISNMPNETNQFGMGMCYSHAATGVLNYYLCKYDKLDCSKAPPESLASALDMARFASDTGDDEIEYSSSYQGIQEGGSPAKVLQAATILVGNVASQACFNEKMIFGDLIIEDKIASDEEVAKQRKFLSGFSSFYEKYSKSGFDEASLPESVVNEASRLYQAKDHDLEATRRRIMRSLEEESFDRFFARFVYPRECARAKNRVFFEYQNQAEFHYYPAKGQKFTYKGMMREIKSAIDKGNPVVVGGACLLGLKGKKCPGDLHALIVYGYATLCDPAGNCHEGLKFQNSFGPKMQEFERANWFSAKEYYAQSIPSKSDLAWVEIKEKSK